MQWHRFRFDTKIILWTLFLIQLLLIGVFWMLQQSINEFNGIDRDLADSNERAGHFKVNFISGITRFNTIDRNRATTGRNGAEYPSALVWKASGDAASYRGSSFRQNYQIEVRLNSNYSKDFAVFYSKSDSVNSVERKNVTCFREGTKNLPDDGLNSTSLAGGVEKCQCKQEWHGNDCGQPEVLWRALMTSKLPLSTVVSDGKLEPNKIFFVITGYFVSLDLLEIQIMELIESVDLFIICNQLNSTNVSLIKRLKLIFKSNINYNKNFIKQHSSNYNSNNDNSYERFLVIKNHSICSPKSIYNELRQRLDRNSIKSNDIYLFTNGNEILNNKAVKYLKYYYYNPNNIISSSKVLFRFRLKHIVYGFFWHHPNATHLSGIGCTVKYLDDLYEIDEELSELSLLLSSNSNHLGKNNRNSTTSTDTIIIIIGDLNHFGGWYCEYCHQPNDIIETLKLNSYEYSRTDISNTNQNNIFPLSVKNHLIDTIYIQNLIASGLYVDGKLRLKKLYRFGDKYYAPDFVENNNWKFDNLLINLYLSFDDDSYEN